MSQQFAGFEVCENSKGLLSKVMMEMYLFLSKKNLEDLNYTFFVLFLRWADLLQASGCQGYFVHHGTWLV